MAAKAVTSDLTALRDPRLTPADLGEVASIGSAVPYTAAPYHWRIAREFVEVAEGRTPLLIIQVAVQHGKTQLASVQGSAWYLGTHPERHVLAASYSSDFAANKIGRPARDLFERVGDSYFGVGVDASSSAKDQWSTDVGGGFYAAGVDRGIAGRRVDLGIIDDPHAGAADVASATQRAQLWTWYATEFQTRKAPGAGEIIISSRWAQNDFVGAVIENCQITGRPFKLLDFAALAICSICGDYGVEKINACGHNVRDSLARLPGEALWPNVRNRDFLLEQRRAIGSRAFLALYQGRPTEVAGSVFRRDWLKYATYNSGVLILELGGDVTKSIALDKCLVYSICDLAISQSNTADWFVCGTFALTPSGELVLIDVVRERATAQRQRDLVNAVNRRFRPVRIGVEVTGYQKSFAEYLTSDGLPIKELRPSADKVSRAMTASARAENGTLFILKSAWTEVVVDELVSFPTGKHDDCVDVVAYASEVATQAQQRNAPIGLYLPAGAGIRIG